MERVGSFIFPNVDVCLVGVSSAGLADLYLKQIVFQKLLCVWQGWKRGERFLQGECSKGVCADGVLFKFPSVTEQ